MLLYAWNVQATLGEAFQTGTGPAFGDPALPRATPAVQAASLGFSSLGYKQSLKINVV